MSNASFFKKMSSLFTALSGKKYRTDTAAQALSPQQQTALWSGANMSLDGIIGIAEDLMKDSPWTQHRLS
ncbi:hypothetical protein PBAL39_12197 [Pedobacter sp. BAL39]|uniref:hypothetical protein n=1 Tax=Pedobacter sp. BAL39 TaxID=391596 RepID=UPI000155A039|nr:hypothetical protein [Pedobacter sp. BAL39]EDM36466.1 hypothetical protein PBAL39_12197 [Pedobacter sp. BAL39]